MQKRARGRVYRLPAWTHAVAAACGVLLVLGLVPGARDAHVAAAPSQTDDLTCVLRIGDVTGDDRADLAVSPPVARERELVVYLVAGQNTPPPARLSPSYVRANLVSVLTGPAAVPFVCHAAPVKRIEAMGTARRQPPVSDAILDQPVKYFMVDLDPLMPTAQLGFSSVANEINAAGQVAGRFLTPQGEQAFVYDRGEVRGLGTLGGHISDGRAINRFGQTVGYSLTGVTDSFGFIQEAFTSDGFQMRGLGLDWSVASAINDAGTIAGEMRISPGVDLSHAFLYNQGAVTDLGSLPPLADSAYSAAHAINEAGHVVGQSNTYVLGSAVPTSRHFAVRAFLYERGAMRDLGSLGPMCIGSVDERCFERSVATDINNAGQIVGFSSTPTTLREHAFLSNGQGMQDLGTLGGSGSWAYGVNDSGQIVGGFSSEDDRYFAAFLRDRGTMHDLNDLIVNPSDAMPFAAYDINNFGQIVGNHHLLQPLYENVQPEHPFAFEADLGQTLEFAYWVSRGNGSACNAATSRLRLQVKFQAPGRGEGAWIPAGVVSGCGDSIDWQAVSVAVPANAQEQNGTVYVRVQELGPRTGLSMYLRHFSMR